MHRFPRFARIPTLFALAVFAYSSLSFAQSAARSCSGLSPGSTRAQVPAGIVSAPEACTPGNIILDGGFEAATGNPLDSPNWTETSTNFGSPLCSVALCGDGGGTAPPRTGLIWAWFGGIPAPETATLSQTVTFPGPEATTVDLNFYLQIGFVSAPFTDVLNVKVDGVIQTTFTEPAVAEVAYTLRTLNLLAFADNAAHTIEFEYIGPSTDTGNFTVDDVSLDVVCGGLTVTPTALAVDPPPPATPAGNGVLEMNTDSTPIVVPTWRNDGLTDITLTGVASNLTGPAGPTYTIGDSTANYGTVTAGTAKDCLTGTPDCYDITISGTRPQQHFDATMDETVTPLPVPIANGAGVLKTWTLHVGNSFSDVSIDIVANPFYPSIETIFHNGVTVGCGDGSTYCPLQNNLRQEMAVFLLKASQGAGYVPPACTPPGIFSDVPCPSLYADWIEDLSVRGVTAGCSSDPGPPPTIQYCPDRDILRSEMAVFLLKMSHGSGYVPPACTGIFSDVPCPATPTFPFSDWIEDLYLRGITAGCSSDPGPPPTIQFCPDNNVTRQEMAVFLTKTFSLVLYGP